MFCINCGEYNRDEAQSCLRCGMQMNTGTVGKQVQTVLESSTAITGNMVKKEFVSPMFLIAVLLYSGGILLRCIGVQVSTFEDELCIFQYNNILSMQMILPGEASGVLRGMQKMVMTLEMFRMVPKALISIGMWLMIAYRRSKTRQKQTVGLTLIQITVRVCQIFLNIILIMLEAVIGFIVIQMCMSDGAGESSLFIFTVSMAGLIAVHAFLNRCCKEISRVTKIVNRIQTENFTNQTTTFMAIMCILIGIVGLIQLWTGAVAPYVKNSMWLYMASICNGGSLIVFGIHLNVFDRK